MLSNHKIIAFVLAILTVMSFSVYGASPEELVRMGVNYYKGNGVPINKAKAVECWKEAAEQGNATAQFALANCFQRGEGVEQNLEEAAKWFRKAAEQGHEGAIKTVKKMNADANSDTNSQLDSQENPPVDELRPVLPDEPTKIQIQTFSVSSLDDIKIEKVNIPSNPLKVGDIQLPPIPKELSDLIGKRLAIIQTINQLNNGTHPALKEQIVTLLKAQLQYETIKARRDEVWKVLDASTRQQIESQISSNPNIATTSLVSYRPSDMGYGDFLKLIVWGKKTEQAKTVYDKLKEEVVSIVSPKVQSLLEEVKRNIIQEIEPTRDFREKVFATILESCDGYNDASVTELTDEYNDFLAEAIPVLCNYKLWEENELWEEVISFWKERRPCIIKKLAMEDQNRKAGERLIQTISGVEVAFRWCPPSSFMMGAQDSEKGYQVTHTKGFWIMETEVTQKLWKAVMGYNPSELIGDNLPVEQVSWNECQIFCLKTGLHLPTEAQWEYACRAGTKGNYSGYLFEMAWYKDNSEVTTHPVGTKKNNAWGLYDMHGNVAEWCYDWHISGAGWNKTDPMGRSNGSSRILRGGHYFSKESECRSAYRSSMGPESKFSFFGFRAVKLASPGDRKAMIKVNNDKEKEIIDSIEQRLTSQINKSVEEEIDRDRLVRELSVPGTKAGERRKGVFNGVEFVFRWCPAGTFMMGLPESEKEKYDMDETPQHEVTLTKGFWILETEITQKQWQAVMDINHSKYKGDDLPVDNVSKDDCLNFCKACARKGFSVQLPTEAQWEYACRAGTTGTYAGDLEEMAWYSSNSNYKTHPVATKKPNAWGLYDMHGNVKEWCKDWMRNYPKDDKEKVIDPIGSSDRCVIRGGSFDSGPSNCRSAKRDYSIKSNNASFIFGFRIVFVNTNSEAAIKNDKTEQELLAEEETERNRLIQTLSIQGTKAGERKTVIFHGVEIAFRWCPPGTFMMGSPESEKNRANNETLHQVTLTKGFWMMETEVTQKLWQTIMGYNPSYYKGENRPVEQVTWIDCQAFYLKTGLHLPTEAQWEYACRAGTKEAYAGNLDDMAWFVGYTKPVGTKSPNAWGLYDMYGNVREWCQDWFGDYTKERILNPTGAKPWGFSDKVVRGGNYLYKESHRSASRSHERIEQWSSDLGFRCVIVP